NPAADGRILLLPAAFNPPRRPPAGKRDHRLVVGTTRRKDRRLHGIGRGGGRFGDARGPDAAAHGARSRQNGGRAEKVSARNHHRSPFIHQRLPASPDASVIGFTPSFLTPDIPPPATAPFPSTLATHKSPFASTPL